MRNARFIAVVPLIGNELAVAVQDGLTPWQKYIQAMVTAQETQPQRVGVFPYLLDEHALEGTVLGRMLSRFQRIAATPLREGETEQSLRTRDLAQGIAQLVAETGEERLTVFISHTNRTPGSEESVETLISTVRDVIRNTRLQEFFDASDLQPGQDWDAQLRNMSATSALFAIRTNLYPSREWCQREVLIAKRSGMPVIIMDALTDAEERGSFLMDHVPRLPARIVEGRWRRADIIRGLNLLVDECLKRVLWRNQAELAQNELAFDVGWWAPHAPEPITFAKWLEEARQAGQLPVNGSLVVLHPDPPLGAEEKSVLQEILRLGSIDCDLDVMTPRLLAARGG